MIGELENLAEDASWIEQWWREGEKSTVDDRPRDLPLYRLLL